MDIDSSPINNRNNMADEENKDDSLDFEKEMLDATS